MVIKTGATIRNASLDDHNKLAYLIHFDASVHRHLDYRPPLDWLGQRPFPLLESEAQIEAALACPPDPPHIAWIRLFASAYGSSSESAWQALWEHAYAHIAKIPGVQWAAAIPLQNWFERLLQRSAFVQTNRILMLSWETKSLPKAPPRTGLSIRPMSYDDIITVAQLDLDAFVPVWQNSRTCLEHAFRQASIATLAEIDGRVLGYQISTPTPIGGHLARLAVLPEWQGQGIGAALLHDLLSQFRSRGARLVTVNTQRDNLPSLALYRKYGFEATGEEYPVYQIDLV